MTSNPTMQDPRGADIVGLDIVPITADDDNDLATHVRAIRCKPSSGTAGTLRITTYLNQVRNTEIAVGETLMVYAKKVHSTGTTATGLEGII